MSTRVELPVPYPAVPECPDPSDFGYAYEDWFSDRSYEQKLIATKRLTDPELAAEYWRSWNLFKTATATHDRDWAEYDRSQTILRFATTPHHTEVA